MFVKKKIIFVCFLSLLLLYKNNSNKFNRFYFLRVPGGRKVVPLSAFPGTGEKKPGL